MEAYIVILSKTAKRNLLKVPVFIVRKLQAWVDSIENSGLSETRKIPGYHDEPLKGTRIGQRSIRLNRAYRAIYEMSLRGEIEIVNVLEVSKHEY